ncbi:hypothetical protein ABZ589_02285 [Streptomyces sp. NPDC013313]|uniref:hypothetical protein n=1 Tax=Streptomyces sp. NPDC013313 TaxID=3155603 RepID=UPI0033E567E7
MADERCDSPGEDHRAPGDWLTGETAERLLRGESLEFLDPAARDQAERLAEALSALSVPAPDASGELRGEEAALAAFRKAREAAEAERTAAAFADGGAGGGAAPLAGGAREGLVRIAAPARSGSRSRRPRWARPVRLTLAAAVAAGTLGGVAVAAGSGVLPIPFQQDRPAPAASVSAGETHGRPRVSPSTRAPLGPGDGTGTPGGGPGASAGGAPSAGVTAGPGQGGTPGPGVPGGPGGSSWREAGAACRDIRDGKELGNSRRRALEGLAGGAARVAKYCESVLAGRTSSAGGDDAGNGSGDGSGDGENGGQGNGNGNGNGNGKGKGGTGNGDENGQGGDEDGRGHGHAGGHRGVVVSPSASIGTPLAPGRHGSGPAASPSPTYSAL